VRWRNGHLGRRVVEVRLPGRHRRTEQRHAGPRCIPARSMSVQHIAASLNSFSPSLAREEDLDDLPLTHHAKHVHTVLISRKFINRHMFRLATAALSLIPAMQPLRAGVAMPARALASRAAEKTGPIFDVVFCAN
jgi:hypothetical protein